MCSHSDANAAKSEHMAHLCPCSHHLRPRFCPPARLQLANSHNMLASIGVMVDSSRVLPLLACMCSIMNVPVLNNECACVHFWMSSAKLPSKSEHPRLCHTQPAQRLDYVHGAAAILGSRKAGVSSTDRLCVRAPPKSRIVAPTLLLACNLRVRESEDRVGLKGCALLSGF